MNGLWILVAGLGLIAAIVALISAWQRRGQRTDLGTVSHQWIMENRLGSEHDSRR